MTSILVEGHRFEMSVEGSRFDRHINAVEFDAVQNAQDIHDLTSIWGRIQDWFCGTRKEQAKQDLFILMKNTYGKAEKMAAFCRLYNEAAEPYRRNFNCEVCEDNEGKKLVSSIDCDGLILKVEQPVPDELVESKVVKSIEDHYFEEAGGQLDKDVFRQNCSFYGGGQDLRYKTGDGIGGKVKRKEVTDFLNGCASAYQRKMLDILASQSGIIDLIGQENQRDKHFFPFGSSGRIFNVEVNKLPCDNVRVDIVFAHTIPDNQMFDDVLAKMREDERPHRSIQVAASFLIGKDETVCLNADYSHVA